MSRSNILSFTSLFIFAPTLLAGQIYVRAAGGIASAQSAAMRDVNCESTDPAALFGCGAGRDGRPLQAWGSPGSSLTWSAGAGYETGRLRAGFVLEQFGDFSLDAQANFRNVTGPQPVGADIRSRAIKAEIAIDLSRPDALVHPFVMLGAGKARNHISEVRYEFPTIAPDAVTITPAGNHDDTLWSAAAGVSTRLTRSLDLDVSIRYDDRGDARTETGIATIVRPRGTFEVEIAPTRIPLKTVAVEWSLRYRF
jgi:hypothetical protein